VLGLVFTTSSSHAAPILVLGDSLSAGFGMAANQGWVSLWQQRLQSQSSSHQIINASLSGETTTGGLARLPALLDQHHPHWVIIELGANDALRGQSLSRLEINISQMISLAKTHNAQVLLLGIQLPTNYGDAFNQRLRGIYAKLAAQHNTLLDPFFLADVALLPNGLQADGLHPTAEVQPMIMERIVKILSLEKK